MREYIVTEEQIKHLETLTGELRFHRYTSLTVDVTYEEYLNILRKSEREKVLDEVLCKLTDEIDDRTRTFKGLHLAIKIVRELREGKGGERE